MKRVLGTTLLAIGIGLLSSAAAVAGKGDRVVSVQRSSPLLERRVLDLRFAEFAQGIWARDGETCAQMSTIDRAAQGSTVAVFRGLLETPGRICLVYGAEQRAQNTQRAALNCDLDTGEEALGLVTVRRRGSDGLMLQEGEREPQFFRFCRSIPPVTGSLGQ
ncbi:hypothetical protein [Roseibium sp.]|uniref:hypothetical protein n=1 Tax=Roseibium sp. TaxID=1936156 RepID=UPI003A97A49E